MDHANEDDLAQGQVPMGLSLSLSLNSVGGCHMKNEHCCIDLIWFDLWHLLYFLFLVSITKMIIYSFLSLFGVYVHLFWTLVMYNRFYRAFEGHSEQAVQYSMNNVFPKFYGSVGLDVALPNCLYCYCVVSWKYGKISLIWFDLSAVAFVPMFFSGPLFCRWGPPCVLD